MEAKEIKELFGKFGADLDRDDVWKVQQAVVIKHKALERLAAAAGIRFDAPTIVRAERDEAVILAIGRLGDVSEWSIGEALINMNYKVSGKQAGYVYAMAEKRAKDRVILKLAGLHGLYSEDEADEFKQQQHTNPAHSAQDNAAGANATPPAKAPAANLTATAMIAKIKTFDLMTDLIAWANSDLVHRAYKGLPPSEAEAVDAAYNAQQTSIEDTPFVEAAE